MTQEVANSIVFPAAWVTLVIALTLLVLLVSGNHFQVGFWGDKKWRR